MDQGKIKSHQSMSKKRFLHSIYRPSFLVLMILFILLPLSLFVYDYVNFGKDFDRITKKLSVFDKQAQQILEKLSEDSEIQAYLLGEKRNPYETLYPAMNESKLEMTFYLVSPEGVILASNNHKLKFYGLESTYFNSSIFLDQHMKSKDVHFGRININEFEVGYHEFAYIRGIYAEDQFLGSLVFSLNKDLPQYLLNSLSNVIITDKQGFPIHATADYDFNSLHRMTDDSIDRYARKRKSYYKHATTNTMEIWFFFDYQVYLKIIILEMIFIISLRIVFKISLLYISSTNLENKIQLVDDIILGLEEFDRGNFHYRLNLTESEKTNLLVKKYNALLEQVENLVHKNIEIHDQKQLAELKQLQSQYNPHFLYNALETIKYLALTNPKQAFEMTTNLGKLLRYNVETQDDIETSLSEELKYTEYYLMIQKERFESKLNYFFLVDESLLDEMVPKFIIQPLVENSIKHAYTGAQSLEIVIMLEMQKEGIMLYVMDNGQGMSSVELAEVRQDVFHGKKSSFGLHHTYQKLKLLYGKDVSMQIESSPDQGTNIVILLKKRD